MDWLTIIAIIGIAIFGILFTKVIKMTLKQRRIDKGLTQAQCAGYLQIPLRTYKRYESKEEKIDPIKYQYIVTRLNEYGLIDEEHGTLTISQIRSDLSNIMLSMLIFSVRMRKEKKPKEATWIFWFPWRSMGCVSLNWLNFCGTSLEKK